MMSTENETETDEAFLDASDSLQNEGDLDLLATIEEVSHALDLFLYDRCLEAMKLMDAKCDDSFYHSVGNNFLHLMQAFLSYEPKDIECAIKVMKSACDVCNESRHPSSIMNNAVTKMVMRPNYDTYTEREIHAELCYAECLLSRALLTFIQDDNLVSFIRGGLRIRTSYMIYKECQYILEHRDWPNAKLRDHFASGVYLGLGMFNLIIASLPKRILKLLEFIGFSGDMEVAVKLLDNGHRLQNSLRSLLCTLLNIFYHCMVRYLLGKECDNIDYFDELIVPLVNKYPNGSLILFMAGRLKSLRGNISGAVKLFETSVFGQVEWNKFRQFSYWDLTYFCMFLGDYRNCLKHAEILRSESNWSKAFYTYIKAALLCSCEDLTFEETQEMIELMEKVPSLKQRVVGKSIPAEKFVAMKSEKFLDQNNWLFLPALEILYLWNYFLMVKGNFPILDSVLVRINRALDELNEDSHRESPYYMDNYCLGIFLKGVCLSYMGSPLSAEELFIEVYENQKSLKKDQYLVACSLLELGLICIQTTNYEQAVQYLNLANRHFVFAELKMDNNTTSISGELETRKMSNEQQVALQTNEDSEDEDDEEEGFVDASENVLVSDEITLLLSDAEETTTAFRMLVMEDKFEEAVARLKPFAQKTVYHSLGVGILYYMKAFMTFEPSDIESAVIALKESADVCNLRRHRSSITNNVVTKMIIRPNYNTYTDEEVVAELSYASCLFLRACLSFFQDSNLISFIRGGLRIRTSYQILKECHCILENRKWPNNELKKYFKSGVCYGLGVFNLLFSSLPKRVMKLLQFIGFSGDREIAKEMLDTGNLMTECFPGLSCTLVNIFYHTFVCCVIGSDDCDTDYIGSLVHPLLKDNPKSTLILYFSGRLEHLKGNVRGAIELLQKSIAGQVECETFRQFSYWELYFCHIATGQYRVAVKYVDELKKGSNWSKAIYTFFEAAALCMCADRTEEENEQIKSLMKQVPELRKRLAGKSFPPEKYVEKRSRRFFLQNNWLLLPAFEMMYVFNYLFVIKNKVAILDPMLARVNWVLEEIKDGFDKESPYFMDNYCLALFLKGVCLSYMGSPYSAEEVFVEIYENRKNILEDHHIISCTLLELGIIYKDMGNYERAVHYLHAARKSVAFYTEFRIHHVLQDIKLIVARCDTTATNK